VHSLQAADRNGQDEECTTIAKAACRPLSLHSSLTSPSMVRLTDLTLGCAAGSACRSRRGAAVAANDVRSTESQTATDVTPSCWRQRRQLGCRAKEGRTTFSVGTDRAHRRQNRPGTWVTLILRTGSVCDALGGNRSCERANPIH
jgi:hypothetical protein